MKILHFAVENYARVPANLVKAERQQGHDSTLVTLYSTFQKYDDEDLCLQVPFVNDLFSGVPRSLFMRAPVQVTNRRRTADSGPPVWRPGRFDQFLFSLRDKFWERKIRPQLEELNISSCDILFLDGGAGFLRSGKIVRELKSQGVTIVVCYCGSDLRTRGAIPAVDDLSDFRFTFEFDHTLLRPDLTFLFFPFELVKFDLSSPVSRSEKVRIGHAPTSRAAKGTEEILPQLEMLVKSHDVEVVLIEGLPHPEALRLKATCDIFVDTVGELGYGINSLESLAMGIPTAVQLLPDFEAVLGDHPFINVTAATITEKLIPYVESDALRKTLAEKGKTWVAEHHNPVVISRQILDRIGGKGHI